MRGVARFDRSAAAARLDAHLVLPLLEFASAKKTHDAKDLMDAKMEILNATNMCDLAAEVSGQGETAEMKAKRARAVETHGTLAEAAARGVKFASDANAMRAMRRDKAENVKFAAEHHGVTSEDVEALYKFAKFEYECGDYASASEHLGRRTRSAWTSRGARARCGVSLRRIFCCKTGLGRWMT